MTSPDTPKEVDKAAQERWLRRIKGLLAKAEVSDNEAERDALRSKAFYLAAEYRIDMAALQSGSPGVATNDKIITVMLEVRKPFIQRMTLINTVAKVNGCACICAGRKSSVIELLELTGFESDVTLVRMLVASLATQAERGFAAATVPAGVKPRTFRRGYWEAFAAAIYRRMHATKEATEIKHGTPGTAIVLRDRATLVQEDVEFRYPTLRKARRSNTRLGHGRREGYEDGMRADIGTDNKVGSHFHQGEIEG